MSSNRVDRFQKRKQVLQERSPVFLLPTEELVQAQLQSSVDEKRWLDLQERWDDAYKLDSLPEVTPQDVESLLQELRQGYHREQTGLLLRTCRESALNAIVSPFGLGELLNYHDKDGGNVNTIQNVKNGHIVSEDARFDRKQYRYSDARKVFLDKHLHGDGTFIDQYTGNHLQEGQVNVDHITPLHEFHVNGGFMKSTGEKTAFASDERNFAITDDRLNKSKGAQDLHEFRTKTVKGQEQNNKERFEMDNRRVNPAAKRSQHAVQDHLPTAGEKAAYYLKESARTSVESTVKMGIQQMIGLILHELATAVFDEIRDIFANGWHGGRSNVSFLNTVGERLSRVGQKVLRSWKKVLSTAGMGALSGFVSNFVTTLLNTVMKTGARTVRMIREGIFSLLRALKLCLFPPAGMTKKQAAHEATKLIASGLVITGGIALEEIVEKGAQANPFLAPFAGLLVPVVMGIATGVSTALVVHLVDKLDLFGVKEEESHLYVLNRLDDMTRESVRQIEESWSRISSPLWVT